MTALSRSQKQQVLPNWHNCWVYIPKHFQVTEWDEITGFVACARAADLVTVDVTGLPIATLMPCIWDTSTLDDSNYGSLIMHMARANPQWKSIERGAQGLAIVHGPQAYVSPSNYEGKVTDHKVVPTWNYQSVHLSGIVEVSEDVELLRHIVSTLTDFHETDRTKPWSASEADPKYLEAQLRVVEDLFSSALPDDDKIALEMKKIL